MRAWSSSSVRWCASLRVARLVEAHPDRFSGCSDLEVSTEHLGTAQVGMGARTGHRWTSLERLGSRGCSPCARLDEASRPVELGCSKENSSDGSTFRGLCSCVTLL